MEIKKIKLKMREDGPIRNKKWGILKYLSAEFFTEKSEITRGQMARVIGVFDQKLGYDNCLSTTLK